MRYVGEEGLSHPAHLLQHAVCPRPRPENVEHHGDGPREQDYDEREHGDAHVACGALRLIPPPRLANLYFLAAALHGKAYVLYLVQLLHPHQAVLHLRCGDMAFESLLPVAALLVYKVIHVLYFREMFLRLYSFCYLTRLVQLLNGFLFLAGVAVDVCQSEQRCQRVPLVLGRPHEQVCLFVLVDRPVEVSLLLIERSEVGVAQRHPEDAVRRLVELHRLAVVHPRGVCLPAFLEHAADVGIVYGLPDVAAKPLLSLQRHAENTVGALVVAGGHVYVAKPVERHREVLNRRFRGVAALLAYLPCTVVVVGCQVKYA